MKIAIIGAGSVGKALGARYLAAGREVAYGLRAPEDGKYADLPSAAKATIADAVAGAEVIILATPWAAVEDAATAIGAAEGQIIIDATNPLGMTDAGLGLVVGHDNSGGEIVQSLFPAARVVKTFNQIGAEHMASAGALSTPPVMFLASDDEAAKAVVAPLVAELGFDARDAGPLRNARLLEPFAMLWIWNAISGDLGRSFGFALSHRRGS